jgi:LysM repeat protein
MNNENPLVSQGSFVEQKNKGRSRVKVAVFLVLAFHGIGLIALLMTQGCGNKQEKSPEQTPETANSGQPQNFQPTNQVEAPTNAPSQPSNNVAATTPPPPPPPPPAPPAVTTPPEPQAQDYAIAQGDTLGALAKKFGVTLKALLDANPGVQPTKLKIAQKIHIPSAAPSATATPSGAPAGVAEPTEGAQSYAVKSGDTLSSIAKQFGVKIKAIRLANNLTTDRIVVGQKLKIPAKTTAPAPAAGTPAPSDTTAPPAPAPATGPATPAPR